jgi:integrase
LILFVLATVCRVSEARQATASQVSADLWIVPSIAQKVSRGDRRVPLSCLAVEALTMASPEGYLYQGLHGMVSLDSARLKICKIIGRSTTIHGVRSTFRDWCARSGIDRDTAERCLSHEVGTATEQAYLRDDFLEPRRAVLEHWAKILKVGNSPVLKS